MRWFKHLVNLRRDPKIRKVRKKLGEIGYARAVSLMEIVGERGGAATKAFNPKINLRNPLTDLEWLADEWEITQEEALKTLDQLAQVGFINTKSWGKQIVYLPEMKKLLDEWTARKEREGRSRATPESLGSYSRKRKSKRTEVEIEIQSRPNNEGEVHPVTDPQPMEQDCPWTFLGIDRNRIPNKYLTGKEPGANGFFEPLFRNHFESAILESRAKNTPLEPNEFAEIILRTCKKAGIEYPPALLKRKKELDEFS